MSKGDIGNVHSALCIGCNIGGDDLIVVEAKTKVKVWIEVDSGSLDTSTEQKFFVHNLFVDKIGK